MSLCVRCHVVSISCFQRKGGREADVVEAEASLPLPVGHKAVQKSQIAAGPKWKNLLGHVLSTDAHWS